MSWLSNFVKPKLRSLVSKKEVPDDLWFKCPKCEQMIFHRDLKANLYVCNHCQHHMRLSASQRLEQLFDEGEFEELETPKASIDPLKFKDKKRYTDRIKEAQNKTKKDDALAVGLGKINQQKAVVAVFNFNFMGGSMGMAVGEGIVTAAEKAVKEKCGLIIVSSSGGARMQEGILSLMQMPRTIIATNKLKENNLPYISVLADPTTGGVSASFAMLGDVTIAEPGAIIGFAGRRVIQETIREKLPDDFQTAEYLKDHGMVDIVVERSKLANTIGSLLKHFTAQ